MDQRVPIKRVDRLEKLCTFRALVQLLAVFYDLRCVNYFPVQLHNCGDELTLVVTMLQGHVLDEVARLLEDTRAIGTSKRVFGEGKSDGGRARRFV